jgi:sorting and assembly machinery component 37
MLPFPQRYYVPERIREMHRPRLEAVGLWSLNQRNSVLFRKRPNKVDHKDEYARVFERDGVSAPLPT